MSMFVSQEGIPVCVDGDDVPPEQRNIIYIKAKMDVGTQNRMLSAILKVREETGDEDGTNMSYDLGAYYIALLRHNIVKWEGPAFQGVPCTPENIERLDPDEPLVERVLERLNESNTARQKRAKEKSPNGARPAGRHTSRGSGSAGR